MRVSLTKDFDRRCPHCGRLVTYSQRYDSFLCMPCNLWLEKPCSDSACEFCAGRATEPDGVRDLDAAKLAEAEHAPPTIPNMTPPKADAPRQGRNRPCLCGSGKKFKMCCGTKRNQPLALIPKPHNNAHFLERLGRLFS